MRILFVTEFFPDFQKLNFSGGVEARTFFIAQNLGIKHEVIVISRRKTGEKKKEELGKLKVFRLGRQISVTEANFYSIFFRLYFIIQSFIFSLQFKPDLVEGSNFVCYPSSWLLAKVKRRPGVAWFPDLLGKEWLKKFGIFTGLSGLLLEKISLFLPWRKIIALSQETKRKLIRAGIDKEKISVVYGGVPLELIQAIKAKKFKRPTICCVARLVSYKNVACLIRALDLIKKRISSVRLIIIGTGPEEEKLKNLRKDLGLRENIIFKKNLTYRELIKVLKSGHLFCLPSEIEGFGLSTIEALACGLPFVISDIKINKEVTQGKGGLFFKLRNVQDLANKTERVLQDKRLAANLVKAAQSLLKDYDWLRISQESERVYQEVLTGIK